MRAGAALFALTLAACASAQEPMHHHHDGGANNAESFLHDQASGTTQEAQGEVMPMPMFPAGSWNVMLHGLAFLNDTRASGYRGQSQTFSTNWFMAMASRPMGSGALMLRAMLSAEPFTIRKERYPELFQTGETAYGKGIIDGQHPHDLFMELGAEVAQPLGGGMVHLYVAPVGDPALGPTAYPHRFSALEIPQAVISHHFQDSTHIASNVITAGYSRGIFRFEASSFHGAEPDEDRKDLDTGGRLDSASARLTITPRRNVVAQVSFGYIAKPEALEPGDAKRTTASLEYALPFAGGSWTSTAVWGRIYKQSHDQSLESYLAESTVHFAGRHWIAARFEDAQKDELFPHVHVSRVVVYPRFPVLAFRVKAATLGYTFDVLTRGSARYGIGANVTAYRYPELLQVFYGRHPHSRMLYVRTRWGV